MKTIKFIWVYINRRLILYFCAFSVFLKKWAIYLKDWVRGHSLNMVDPFYCHYVTGSLLVIVIIKLCTLFEYLLYWDLAVFDITVISIVVFINILITIDSIFYLILDLFYFLVKLKNLVLYLLLCLFFTAAYLNLLL